MVMYVLKHHSEQSNKFFPVSHLEISERSDPPVYIFIISFHSVQIDV